jgi:hypothetical protein
MWNGETPEGDLSTDTKAWIGIGFHSAHGRQQDADLLNVQQNLKRNINERKSCLNRNIYPALRTQSEKQYIYYYV